MTSECADVRQSLGVYVVGAIDPAERATVDRHVAGCAACRDELAGLAGLPALLGRVSLADVERGLGGPAEDTPPPERLLRSMLAEAGRQHRTRRRKVVLSLAASFVLLAGAGAGAQAVVSSLMPRPAPAAAVTWHAVTASDAATGVGATVMFRAREWGTAISVWVTGVRRGTWCQLWVTDSSGRNVPAGSWQVPYEDHGVWYPGSTSVAAGRIVSFEITSHGRTLVTVPTVT